MTSPATHRPTPPAGVEDALDRLRRGGGRVTRAKRAVADLLMTTDASLTAEEIVDRLADHDRSSIYRCLAQFEELGIAEHVHLGHGRAVYRRCGLPTVPVACLVCGATVELDRSHTEDFAALVHDRTGVALDLSHFPLTGRCARCAAAERTR